MYGDRIKNKRTKLGRKLRRIVTQAEVAAVITEARRGTGGRPVDGPTVSRCETYGCNKDFYDEVKAALDVIEALSRMAVPA
jgi:hypothetical protein